mmetsp:Transcript_43240/g.107585  ORF Transcript_43240/g.107585 Transcript_43240/m.107585 type:complete len:250 (-) Transcript_43240:1106-1855(-)
MRLKVSLRAQCGESGFPDASFCHLRRLRNGIQQLQGVRALAPVPRDQVLHRGIGVEQHELRPLAALDQLPVPGVVLRPHLVPPLGLCVLGWRRAHREHLPLDVGERLQHLHHPREFRRVPPRLRSQLPHEMHRPLPTRHPEAAGEARLLHHFPVHLHERMRVVREGKLGDHLGVDVGRLEGWVEPESLLDASGREGGQFCCALGGERRRLLHARGGELLVALQQLEAQVGLVVVARRKLLGRRPFTREE